MYKDFENSVIILRLFNMISIEFQFKCTMTVLPLGIAVISFFSENIDRIKTRSGNYFLPREYNDHIMCIIERNYFHSH